jgi:CubicO group peptidase (beta-lactamase class C family)
MRFLALVLCSAILGGAGFAKAAAGEEAPAAGGGASKGLNSPLRLSSVDSIIQQAIADHNIPGAVLVVGHDGKVIYRKAYGERSLEPKREPMTLDTIFDMASLTKVVATTTAVMQLMETGQGADE